VRDFRERGEITKWNGEMVESGLIAKGVCQEFIDKDSGAKVIALKDLNLDVTLGEIVGLIGPSGCGKSTFLRTVAGLDKPTCGELVFNGRRIEKPEPSRGFVFQQASLFSWYTVYENIAFSLKAIGQYKQRKHEVQELIDAMGLTGFERAYPHQISGGMASRTALAQTFIQRPDMILLDEPLSALDAFTRMAIQDEILKRWADYKPTILLVTHDIEEAVYLCDRVVILSPRPGHVIGEVAIDIERPRDRVGEGFVEKRRQIMDLLQFD
jgi:sulfonate transport system ATP-binding protein